MTDRLEGDATTARRMAAMSHAIRREVLRAPSREALLEAACRVAVENGGLRLAWVGWLQDGAVVPVARAGHDEGYVDAVAPSLLKQPSQGPTARSLLRKEAAYTDDFRHDPRMEPWRELAASHGLVSSAALPLRARGQVVASLNIYSGAPGMFRGETRAVLEELADDISFTLDRLQDVVDLERARADYHLLFEQAADGIFLADATGRYLDVNEAGVRLLGYTPDELRQLRMQDLISAEDLNLQPLRIEVVKPARTTVHLRRLMRKDGTVAEVEIAGTRLADGRIQGIVRDVSERNRLMAELVQADRLAAVGRLAAGIAHEVNNPLAYVLLNLSLLVRHLEGTGPVAAPPVQLAKDAMEGAERVADIVRDLRAMTRARDETVGPVDLQAVAEAALRMAGHQVRRRARVVTEFQPCEAVSATRARLEQVVINLLVNAAQAIAGGAPGQNVVTVRVFTADGYGVLEVQDTGAGIPRAVQPRIFDPFFTTRGAGEGTGLGLAISQNLVAAVHGRLTFTSEEGKGTTFRMEVPLAQVAQVEAPPPAPAPKPLDGVRVLVVDDEAGIRDAIVRLLPRCAVVTAANVAGALAALKQQAFDVVLSDVLMPGATAVELLSALQREHAHLVPRLVFMTGAAGDDAVRTLLEHVDAPLLEKPFDGETLERTLRRVLANGA